MDTRYLYNKGYYIKARKHQRNALKLDKMMDIIMRVNPKKVLDIGCGVGYLVEKLREAGVDAYGTDFSPALIEYWKGDPHFQVADAKVQPFKDREFDLVVSTDVLEHISEDDIPLVLEEMKRVGKRVIAFVAGYKPLNRRQLLFHVTNKEMGWWVDNLPGVEVYNSRDFI